LKRGRGGEAGFLGLGGEVGRRTGGKEGLGFGFHESEGARSQGKRWGKLIMEGIEEGF